jgi:hypothetical protein
VEIGLSTTQVHRGERHYLSISSFAAKPRCALRGGKVVDPPGGKIIGREKDLADIILDYRRQNGLWRP